MYTNIIPIIEENEVKIAIGLMSGTSRDGIDAAMIRTDGLYTVEQMGFWFEHYPAETKSQIAGACNLAASYNRPQSHPIIDQCQAVLNDHHLRAASALIREVGISSNEVSIIGLHGHTIAHRADKGWTWQIGDPRFLANGIGINVMSDMRRYDVMFGGQGAPLIPVFHRALFVDPAEPVAVLNLGGVANLTYIEPNGNILAFDCGPANALIDDWISLNTNYEYDDGGSYAAQGNVAEAQLDAMLAHPFFSAPFPKSLDRDNFDLNPVAHLSRTDGAATLTAFSAKAVSIGLNQLPSKPARLIVCGGGRKNATMLAMIEKYSKVKVTLTDELGWNGDAIEAQGFAYLAYRCLYGLPITYPGTTGVIEPMSGGVLCKPDDHLRKMVAA